MANPTIVKILGHNIPVYSIQEYIWGVFNSKYHFPRILKECNFDGCNFGNVTTGYTFHKHFHDSWKKNRIYPLLGFIFRFFFCILQLFQDTSFMMMWGLQKNNHVVQFSSDSPIFSLGSIKMYTLFFHTHQKHLSMRQ